MPNHDHILCPRCNSEFECKMGTIQLCHCSRIELTDAQREWIARQWDTCLCHNCLQAISQMPESGK
ncbi:MAG: hypothetical protein Tsb002_20770 [Wenzhouxiangellaceae bacterium]